MRKISETFHKNPIDGRHVGVVGLIGGGEVNRRSTEPLLCNDNGSTTIFGEIISRIKSAGFAF